MALHAAKRENLVVRRRNPQAESLEQQGLSALEKGGAALAMPLFEEAYEIDPSPLTRSCLAYCMATEQRGFPRAIGLCIEALREEPNNYLHYLYFGRVQVAAGRRKDAIRMFMKGQAYEPRRRISVFHEELIKLGIRKSPPIPILSRNNLLNKYLGLLLSRLGLR